MNLERLFKDQVERDKVRAIERVVQGWGVYLPCEEPKNQVDYIVVGMEPSFGWADSIENAKKKIAGGFRNFGRPINDTEQLALFMLSIERFLCQPGETYHLTDVSKGAMPVTVAIVTAGTRSGIPYCWIEIKIVGKPDAPVIAIGKQVETFLQKSDFKGMTCRPLYVVQHYSLQASAHFKVEAEKDPAGFEMFKNAEFDEVSRWAAGLSLAKKHLVFAYKKQFEAILAHWCRVCPK